MKFGGVILYIVQGSPESHEFTFVPFGHISKKDKENYEIEKVKSYQEMPPSFRLEERELVIPNPLSKKRAQPVKARIAFRYEENTPEEDLELNCASLRAFLSDKCCLDIAALVRASDDVVRRHYFFRLKTKNILDKDLGRLRLTPNGQEWKQRHRRADCPKISSAEDEDLARFGAPKSNQLPAVLTQKSNDDLSKKAQGFDEGTAHSIDNSFVPGFQASSYDQFPPPHYGSFGHQSYQNSYGWYPQYPTYGPYQSSSHAQDNYGHLSSPFNPPHNSGMSFFRPAMNNFPSQSVSATATTVNGCASSFRQPKPPSDPTASHSTDHIESATTSQVTNSLSLSNNSTSTEVSTNQIESGQAADVEGVFSENVEQSQGSGDDNDMDSENGNNSERQRDNLTPEGGTPKNNDSSNELIVPLGAKPSDQTSENDSNTSVQLPKKRGRPMKLTVSDAKRQELDKRREIQQAYRKRQLELKVIQGNIASFPNIEGHTDLDLTAEQARKIRVQDIFTAMEKFPQEKAFQDLPEEVMIPFKDFFANEAKLCLDERTESVGTMIQKASQDNAKRWHIQRTNDILLAILQKVTVLCSSLEKEERGEIARARDRAIRSIDLAKVLPFTTVTEARLQISHRATFEAIIDKLIIAARMKTAKQEFLECFALLFLHDRCLGASHWPSNMDNRAGLAKLPPLHEDVAIVIWEVCKVFNEFHPDITITTSDLSAFLKKCRRRHFKDRNVKITKDLLETIHGEIYYGDENLWQQTVAFMELQMRQQKISQRKKTALSETVQELPKVAFPTTNGDKS